jgi:peptidoglycan/LPS O-acetylase OafA/YrhL
MTYTLYLVHYPILNFFRAWPFMNQHGLVAYAITKVAHIVKTFF